MRAGPACLYLNLWNARRSRSGEAALEPQGVVHREALPVVVEVGEDLGVLAPGADPLAPLRLEALYALALTTGMRQGELMGLKGEDLDTEAGSIQVQRTLSTATGGGIRFGAPKTARSRRSIMVSELVLSSLRRHRKPQLKEKVRLTGLWKDHDLVFTSGFGTLISRADLITRSFKPLLKKAGLPDIRFHDLRRTCATLLLGRGVYTKLVQELLGHSSVVVLWTLTLTACPSWTTGSSTRWTRLLTNGLQYGCSKKVPVLRRGLFLLISRILRFACKQK